VEEGDKQELRLRPTVMQVDGQSEKQFSFVTQTFFSPKHSASSVGAGNLPLDPGGAVRVPLRNGNSPRWDHCHRDLI
jgi:hypothetical protein